MAYELTYTKLYSLNLKDLIYASLAAILVFCLDWDLWPIAVTHTLSILNLAISDPVFLCTSTFTAIFLDSATIVFLLSEFLRWSDVVQKTLTFVLVLFYGFMLTQSRLRAHVSREYIQKNFTNHLEVVFYFSHTATLAFMIWVFLSTPLLTIAPAFSALFYAFVFQAKTTRQNFLGVMVCVDVLLGVIGTLLITFLYDVDAFAIGGMYLCLFLCAAGAPLTHLSNM